MTVRQFSVQMVLCSMGPEGMARQWCEHRADVIATGGFDTGEPSTGDLDRAVLPTQGSPSTVSAIANPHCR